MPACTHTGIGMNNMAEGMVELYCCERGWMENSLAVCKKTGVLKVTVLPFQVRTFLNGNGVGKKRPQGKGRIRFLLSTIRFILVMTFLLAELFHQLALSVAVHQGDHLVDAIFCIAGSVHIIIGHNKRLSEQLHKESHQQR